MKSLAGWIGALTLLCAPLFSQEAAPAAKQYTQGIQASWIGLFTGSYALNYEYLIGQTHGVLGEGYFATDDDYTSMGGGVGYRWHWSRKMSSGFLGLAIKYFSSSGDVTINNVKTDYTSTLFSVVPYIGKRWVFGPGISVVLRVGYGYANATFDWSGTLVDDAVEKALKFLGAFDGELSVGFAF